ncbi:MAG TPA: cobalamin biosynthesis protein, partial [Thermopolyspora sp.]
MTKIARASRSGPRNTASALGLVAGVALDAVFADPRRGHPVALFGRAATALERRLYGDSRARGLAYAAVCAGAA